MDNGGGLVRVAGTEVICWNEKSFSQQGLWDRPRHPSRSPAEGTNLSLTERKCAESF